MRGVLYLGIFWAWPYPFVSEYTILSLYTWFYHTPVCTHMILSYSVCTYMILPYSVCTHLILPYSVCTHMVLSFLLTDWQTWELCSYQFWWLRKFLTSCVMGTQVAPFLSVLSVWLLAHYLFRHNHNLQTSKAPLESEVQGTNFFMSTVWRLMNGFIWRPTFYLLISQLTFYVWVLISTFILMLNGCWC